MLEVRPSLVRAQLVDGAIRRLAFARPPERADGGRDEVHARVARGLVKFHLFGVADAIRAHTRVGARILRGTIANAIANTLLHMSWPEPNRDRYVPDAHIFLARSPGLADLVNIESVLSLGEVWMYTDRNTCCLAFRASVNQARDPRYCSTCPTWWCVREAYRLGVRRETADRPRSSD